MFIYIYIYGEFLILVLLGVLVSFGEEDYNKLGLWFGWIR